MTSSEVVEPQIDHDESVLSNEDRIRISNEIQIRVAGELLGPSSETENQVMFKWVALSQGTSLSKRFREIMRDHPELIDQYADTNELHAYNQDAVIVKVEEFFREDPVIATILAKMPKKISEE